MGNRALSNLIGRERAVTIAIETAKNLIRRDAAAPSSTPAPALCEGWIFSENDGQAYTCDQ